MLLALISANTDVALGLVLTIVLPLAGWLVAKTRGSTQIGNAVKSLEDRAEVAEAVSVTARETVKLLAGRVQHLETADKIRAAVAAEAAKHAASSTAHGERPRR